MTSHAPGPWKLIEWLPKGWWIVAVTGADGSYTPIYEVKDRSGLANAARIVACVNALDGIPTEVLSGTKALDYRAAALDRARAQRDELVKAIEPFVAYIKRPAQPIHAVIRPEEWDAAVAAYNKARP